jgi:hypothetical protein
MVGVKWDPKAGGISRALGKTFKKKEVFSVR